MKEKKKLGRPHKHVEEENQALSIRLPLGICLTLRHLAVDARVSVNEMVNAVIQEFMSKKPTPDDVRKLVKK